MATDKYKKPRDVGSESPASEEAKQQSMSGDMGPQAEQTEGTPKQPAQTSGRRLFRPATPRPPS